MRTVKQRRAWLERQGIVGFIFGGTEALKAADHSLKGAHGLLHFDAVTTVNRGLQRQEAAFISIISLLMA